MKQQEFKLLSKKANGFSFLHIIKKIGILQCHTMDNYLLFI